MHINDGLILNNTAAPLAIVMWAVSLITLAWSWKKTKTTYSHQTTALLAITSAFIFAAQMINYPIAFGTSGHLVGGTFLAILLGPFAAILSMTIVLLMQAFFFADGGILAFGMNMFNMAIIGGLSFFLIKLITRKTQNPKWFATSVFAASWLSVVIGAVITSFEVAPAFTGGLAVTLPPMLLFYSIIGLGEGAITTMLITALQRFNPALMTGLSLLKEKINI